MKSPFRFPHVLKHLIAIMASLANVCAAPAQGTAFTYQGRLNDGSNPASGNYDLRFNVYDAPTNGALMAGPATNFVTGVTNGLFAVTLDFGGGVFSGPGRWLNIEARTNGNSDFTPVGARQALTASPYAIFAGGTSNFLGVVPGSGLSGTYPAAINFSNSANSFSGDGAGLTNVQASTVAQTNRQFAVNPLAQPFNAVGDGVTDDRAALSNAIVAAGQNGWIDLQNRQYAINGGLIIANPGVHFGNGVIIEKARGPAIWIQGDCPSIYSLWLGSAFGNNWQSGDQGFLLSTNNGGAAIINATFDHVFVTNFYQDFVASNLVNSIIRQSAFSGSFSDAILIANVNEVLIQGCDPGFSGPGGYGIRNEGIGTSQSLTNCWGIRVIGGIYVTVENSDINGCRGMYFEQCGVSLRRDNMEALFMTSNAPAITFQGCGSVTVEGTSPNPAVQGGSTTMCKFAFWNCYLSQCLLLGSGLGGGRSYDIDVFGGGSDGARYPRFDGILSVVRHTTFGDATAPITMTTLPSESELNFWTYPQYFLWGDTTFGGDFGTNTVTVGHHHEAALRGFNYSASKNAMIEYDANAFGSAAIYFGYDPIWGTPGWTQLYFGTSANSDATPGAAQWLIDGFNGGAFYPLGAATLGLSTSRISIGYFSKLDVAGDVSAKTFTTTSDRAAKEHFAPVDTQAVLTRVTELPISRWNFKADPATHLGPMAQDFHAAFGIGADDRHIATVDEEGVALAAIQGLNQKLEEDVRVKDDEIAALQRDLAELKATVARLAGTSAPASTNRAHDVAADVSRR
jgi:hypothetical protein